VRHLDRKRVVRSIHIVEGASENRDSAKQEARLEPINVALIGVNRMLSQIVKDILDVPDVHVAAECPFDHDVLDRVNEVRPDVVIFATTAGGIPPPLREMFAARPHTKVLTIRDDGLDASLFELRPHETGLGQVSPETLLEAVRTARTAPL
jgi:hypothetical protein